MTRSLLRIAAGTAVVAATVAFHGDASAHSNTVTCVDQTTSTWRITNDYPLAESFTSPQGPSGTVAAGNGSYTDVVYVGDSLQIDAEWSDGFTESRTGTGDCTPEGGTTTTTTELVTTTTEPGSTTSTTSSTTPTTEPSTTTTPSTLATTTTDAATTTTEPSTSSSVATTSTTSVSPTTSPSTSSSPPPAPSSTTPDQPICEPVEADINGDGDTSDAGENSCYRLPATGTDVLWLLPAAIFMTLCGGVIVICGRRTS